MMITRARTMGFCFGVKNTVKLADELVSNISGPVYSLGEIVHNKALVDEYSDKGLKVISQDFEVKKGKLLIRAHGVRPEVEESFRNKGFEIIDGTCPIVKQNQIAASKAKWPILLFCKKGHDEAVGIMGYANHPCTPIETEDDVNEVVPGEYTVIVQTTFSDEKLSIFTKKLEEKGCVLHFSGSGICYASRDRRTSLVSLCGNVDMVIVIGDENSANSKTLFLLASSLAKCAYMISGSDEVTKEMARFEKVGITAGASVPESVVKSIEERLLELSIDV